MIKPKKTIDELRATANARAKRYQQAQRDSGKKHLSLLVSQEVSDIIAGQRERTGATIAKVVESAIMIAYGEPEFMDIPQTPELVCRTQEGFPELELIPEQGDDLKPEPEIDRVQVDPSPQLVDTPMEEQFTPQPVIDQGEESGIPDCHGKDLTMDEKDSILISVVDLYPGRANAQKRADVLNQSGVLCGNAKTPWNAKKVMDNLIYPESI